MHVYPGSHRWPVETPSTLGFDPHYVRVGELLVTPMRLRVEDGLYSVRTVIDVADGRIVRPGLGAPRAGWFRAACCRGSGSCRTLGYGREGLVAAARRTIAELGLMAFVATLGQDGMAFVTADRWDRYRHKGSTPAEARRRIMAVPTPLLQRRVWIAAMGIAAIAFWIVGLGVGWRAWILAPPTTGIVAHSLAFGADAAVFWIPASVLTLTTAVMAIGLSVVRHLVDGRVDVRPDTPVSAELSVHSLGPGFAELPPEKDGVS